MTMIDEGTLNRIPELSHTVHPARLRHHGRSIAASASDIRRGAGDAAEDTAPGYHPVVLWDRWDCTETIK